MLFYLIRFLKKHGGILKIKIYILIIGLGLGLSSFAAKKSVHARGLAGSFEKIHISKTETKLANNFKELFKLARKGIVNERLVRKLNTRLHQNPTFKEYTIWTQGILNLSRVKKLRTIKRTCTKLKSKNYDDLIQKELNQNLQNICFNKYIKRLTLNSGNSLRFHQREAKYIEKNSKAILFRRNLTDIQYFLSRFAIGKKAHKLYSQVFIQHYVKTDSTPSKRLLNYLHLTAADTRFIQTKDLEIWKTRSVFYRELKKLKGQAFQTVDTSKSSKEIKKDFDTFLTFLNKTYKYQPHRRALASLLSLSKSYMRRGHYVQAQAGFKRILQQKKYHVDDTIFEYMWSYILQEQYYAAVQLLKDYKLDKNFLYTHSKIHFWVAYSYSKLGYYQDATNEFERLIKENPLSYYAILSAKILSQNSGLSTREIYLSNLSQDEDDNVANQTLDRKWLKRIVTWGTIHNPRFVSLELKNLQKKKTYSQLQAHILTAAYHLSTHEAYLESFKIIYRSINAGKIKLTENTLKILFPKPYMNQIKANTKGFDPIIALSLIRQESGFNARARSHVGARGLMQLMPTTARQFKRRLKKSHLYNPNLNIQLGTKYFTNLLTNYNHNLVYSLAAYNAGESRVNEWQEEYLTSSFILENIENIPFYETRKYVKLIFRNIFFYKMILNETTEDTANLNRIYDIHLGFES